MADFRTGLYVGEFHHNLDEKGRLTIPATWRPVPDSPENAFLALPVRNDDGSGYVTVYPPEMIAQLKERIAQISIGDLEGQRAVTDLMAMAHGFSCDKQGRINLNDKLVAHAKIEKAAILLGKLSTFSIYSENVYKAFRLREPADPKWQADVFARFGL